MKQPNEYSDDEIYEMLKPKLKKAGLNATTFVDYLTGKQYTLHQKTPDGFKPIEFGNDTKRAIALAYRSGYLRAKKGRSFIIGEKKPVTKVRFIDEEAHESCPQYYPPVGTIGVVLKDCVDEVDFFVDWGEDGGVKRDYKWYCDKDMVEVIE